MNITSRIQLAMVLKDALRGILSWVAEGGGEGGGAPYSAVRCSYGARYGVRFGVRTVHGTGMMVIARVPPPSRFSISRSKK